MSHVYFRFNRLAWGYTGGGRQRGVIVAGMENGELDIWDPSQILASAECVMFDGLTRPTHFETSSQPVRIIDPAQQDTYWPYSWA